MADIQRNSNNILSYINSLMSALQFDYNNNSVNVNLFQLRSDIIGFIVEFFKETKGYDWLIEKIANYLTVAVPALEYSSKIIFLSYIETMLSCSVKPIITEKMIREGVYFDLQKIDLLNKLNFQPSVNTLDENNPGRYLYFDTENLGKISELKNATDFDAFLWYVKNTPGVRHTWRKEKDRDKDKIIKSYGELSVFKLIKSSESGTDFNFDNIIYCKQKDNQYVTLTGKVVENIEDYHIEEPTIFNQFNRQPKSNGIITLEYNAKSSNLSTYNHKEQLYVEEPTQNCLHVFFGCAEGVNIETSATNVDILRGKLNDVEEEISKIENIKEHLRIIIPKLQSNGVYLIKEYRNEGKSLYEINELKEKCEKEIKLATDIVAFIDNKGTFQNEGNLEKYTFELLDGVDVFDTKGKEISHTVEFPDKSLVELYRSRNELVAQINELTTTDKVVYPDESSNYYLNHPLLEFNYDLIFSMDWFNDKVLAAQLVDALTNCFKFNPFVSSLSFNSQIVETMVGDLIKKMIKNEDVIINDCFFNFSNDEYNSMLEKTELLRMGINTHDGNNIYSNLTPESLLKDLNTISSNSTKEEISTAIESTIFNVVSAMKLKSETNLDTEVDVDLGRIIEILIEKLIYVIVATILAPKIYMIIMINLKVLGFTKTPGFDITNFLAHLGTMIRDIIAELFNTIIEYFKDLMMDVINELLKMLKPMFLKEQFEYYQNLINNGIECLRSNPVDWVQDAVNYADITDEQLSTNNEC